MKITSKGQVTIPQAIREKYKLWPDTEVEFVERNGRVELRKRRGGKTRGERIVEAIRGTATTTLTTDQIMEMTRGE